MKLNQIYFQNINILFSISHIRLTISLLNSLIIDK